MKPLKILSCFILIIFLGVSFTNKPPQKKTPLKFSLPKGWVLPVYDFNNNALTVEGFELGKKLFYDEILSIDSTISCASCHQQFAAFSTYDHNLSHGVKNSLTTRNAPALQNLAWQKEFMWDGGINHLDVQPLSPLTAPNEMGEQVENVLKKLRRNTVYQKMFKAAFANEGITTKTTMKALSQFMLMLVSSNSKYDKVKRGEDTFNLPQRLGYEFFLQKCVSCHKEPLFTDYSYRNIGMPLDTTLNDFGRMKITRNENDSLKFRVPSLRNVMVTAPYGHDGRFYNTSNVFEHYRNKMQPIKTTDSIFKNKMPLSNFQIGQLTAFLYTLTDTSFLKNPKFAPPNYYGNNKFLIHMH